MSAAASYAKITEGVRQLVDAEAGNDRRRACYLAARAALLIIRADHGDENAGEAAYQLADELSTNGGGK